jgi:Ser/Thr protein kinase RdoA (MazF antagonist)
VADEAGRIVQPWHDRPDAPARHAVLLTWLVGRMHDRGLSPVRLQRVGELTARLHLSAQGLAEAGRLKTTRLAFSPDLQAWAAGQRAPSRHVPPALHRLVTQAATRLSSELSGFRADTDSCGFVHADLHPWNIVFSGQVAGAFDFSDCGWGLHALDLATTLQYLKHPLANNHDHRAQYAQLHDSLLAGYARIRPLPADVQRQIDACVVARMIATLEWILDDWPRPDHRAWGPVFLKRCGAVFVDYLNG